MSSDTVIRVENISKAYTIYEKPEDRLKQFIWRGRRKFYREFKALTDISFDVRKGETVGIIGRNGSGKSTLLQIICGTVAPTAGSVATSGRIAALLELGSGFNPEFTGRENIDINAALMGMAADETASRLDAILRFADIGDFINQPVKTYSSGMFVRLAFAIAVHSDPDILIVDEALSVGDIAFQNRCIQKIQSLKESGTSILFVSHDLSTVQIVCDRVVWIKGGRIAQIGDAVTVCQEYFSDTMNSADATVIEVGKTIPQQVTGLARFTQISLRDGNGVSREEFAVGETMDIAFELQVDEPLGETVFTISIYRGDGDWSVGQTSLEKGMVWPALDAGGTLKGRLQLSPLSLTPANYKICLSAFSKDLKTCYAMTELTTGFTLRANYQTWGKFIHPCTWTVVQ